MPLEVVLDCPIGKDECEYLGEDKKIHRCRAWQKLIGRDPQTGEVVDEWRCVIVWVPILMTEISMTNRGQTAAIEDFRNISVGQQIKFNGLMQDAIDGSKNNSKTLESK